MSNDQELRVLRGLPGSGKTTAANKWVAEDPDWRVRVSKDDIRQQFFKTYKKGSRHQEETVQMAEEELVERLLSAKISVVVDDTENLSAKDAKVWLSLGKKLSLPVEFVDHDTDLETCIRRDKVRLDFYGETAIRDIYKRFFKKGKLPKIPVLKDDDSQLGEVYIPDKSKPKAFIVDIDGTLADMKPCGRGPFEWHRVGEDEKIENVIRVIRTLSYDHTIILMSGRDAVCRTETEEWLLDTGINYKSLYMRPEGSEIPDNVLKIGLFDEHVRDNYNVVGVFDDRKKVCYAWEAIGLTLFRVGPIDADF